MPKTAIFFGLITILSFCAFILFIVPKFYFKSSEPLVFLGDSLTVGIGADEGEDFPTIIGRELGVEVINAGVSGDTTVDAIERFEVDVLRRRPAIVVVELGGNDFLQKVDVLVTKKNMEEIAARIAESGAKLVIVGVRRGVFGNDYENFERDLAKRYKGVYVGNILGGIIGDPQLMADSVHPNNEGYKKIAKRIIRILRVNF